MRVKPEDMVLLKPEKIPISNFKPQDKKMLLEFFFSDERVQLYVSQLLIKRARQEQPASALINGEMQNLNNSMSYVSSNF